MCNSIYYIWAIVSNLKISTMNSTMHFGGCFNAELFFVSVVNVTFPDDKQNYIHRIGRVGRADRWEPLFIRCEE